MSTTLWEFKVFSVNTRLDGDLSIPSVVRDQATGGGHVAVTVSVDLAVTGRSEVIKHDVRRWGDGSSAA